MKKSIYFFILAFLPLFLIGGCANTAAVHEENLTSYTVEIPGVNKEYTFLYLTDTHIIISKNTEDSRILDYSGQRLSVFQKQKEASFVPTLSDWADYANTKPLDGILLGGDIIDSPSASNLEYLDSCLAKLSFPYVYTLGNHDWTFPWEYMTEQGKEEYLPLLSPYMDGYPPIHKKEYEDFIIVAVDNSSNQIHPEALEEYKKILAKKKPVILMLHVPLYSEALLAKAKNLWKNSVVLGGGIHGGIYPNDVSAEFIRLTTAKDSPVAVILAGHVHFGDSHPVSGEKSIPQIIGDAGFKGKGTLLHITGKNKDG